jgi:hypothetical protein
LQTFGKTAANKEIHFICIDKRVQDPNTGKMNIILENGQKIVLPETVTKVPALLLLNDNYRVVYGEAIHQFFKPKQEMAVRQATFNNLEPMAFSLGGGGYGITSDQYSFLDMDHEELSAKGTGGVRQMHNYVDLQYMDKINTPEDDVNYKSSNKIPESLTVEQLQQQREMDLRR